VAAAKARVPGLLAHAANSAATLRSDAAHFDAVRCGVATFGMDPMQLDAAEHGLEPVLTVRSHVADIRRLAAGESTGYSRSFIASEPVLVAEVPIGYADGMRRSLANTGVALVRGQRREIVGNVSMDHVSLLIDADVQVGDVVTLLGRDGDEQVSAEDHARWADTINYEITCGIAGEPRLLRVHTAS
jgi:alanine racemase